MWLHEFGTRNKRRSHGCGLPQARCFYSHAWPQLAHGLAPSPLLTFTPRVADISPLATRATYSHAWCNKSHAWSYRPRVEGQLSRTTPPPRTKLPRRYQSHAWSYDHTWLNVAKIAYQLTISHAWYITYELNPRVGKCITPRGAHLFCWGHIRPHVA